MSKHCISTLHPVHQQGVSPPPKKQQVSTESVKRAKTTRGEVGKDRKHFNLAGFNDEKLRLYVALGNSTSSSSTLLSCDRDPNKVSDVYSGSKV